VDKQELIFEEMGEANDLRNTIQDLERECANREREYDRNLSREMENQEGIINGLHLQIEQLTYELSNASESTIASTIEIREVEVELDTYEITKPYRKDLRIARSIATKAKKKAARFESKSKMLTSQLDLVMDKFTGAKKALNSLVHQRVNDKAQKDTMIEESKELEVAYQTSINTSIKQVEDNTRLVNNNVALSVEIDRLDSNNPFLAIRHSIEQYVGFKKVLASSTSVILVLVFLMSTTNSIKSYVATFGSMLTNTIVMHFTLYAGFILLLSWIGFINKWIVKDK